MLKKKWFRALFRWRSFIILLLLIQVAFIIYVLASSGIASTIVNTVLRIVSFFVVVNVIGKRERGAYKPMWIFTVLLFPVFGGLLYLLFSFQTATKRFHRKVIQAEEKARPLLKLPGDGYDEALLKEPGHAQQIRYLQDFAGFPVYTDSKTKYLSPGEVKLEQLIIELEKAEKYIFLEYFIVQEGEMWGAILDILKRKASEGVKVRLIYDDFGCFILLPKDYARQLQKMGIECAVFNPFRPFLTAKQNNRDHRKIVSIDGKVAFTGGINLADEYINAIDKHGHWKDASIMIEGKAAWSFTLLFLEMWEIVTGADEDYSLYYPWTDKPCEIASSGFVLPYADRPLDKENVGAHVYQQILSNAKKYVYICTPYLIIDDDMLSALSLAAKSGIDVRIITPHIGDKRFVHTTTRSYYRELIGAGVKIYEYTNGFIHSKTFVSDDKIATVGTTNLDFRSLYMHFECGVWMASSEAVMEVKQDFLDTLETCAPITEDACRAGVFKRLIQNLLRIFAPLM